MPSFRAKLGFGATENNSIVSSSFDVLQKKTGSKLYERLQKADLTDTCTKIKTHMCLWLVEAVMTQLRVSSESCFLLLLATRT